MAKKVGKKTTAARSKASAKTSAAGSKPATRPPAKGKVKADSPASGQSGTKVTRKKAAKRETAKAGVAARPARKTKLEKVTLDPVAVAAWRMARQGLDQQALHPPRDLSEAVGRSGWLSVPDGATPYLSMVARYASFDRHNLDSNLFQTGTLMEVPGMRGIRMVVPPTEAWMALQAFRPRVDALLKELLSRYRVMTRAALMNLEDVVRAVLAGQALPVETLRTRVPARLVKELGAAGARHGLQTSVDLALWHLWCQGEVVSRPVERRLDRQRREYLLRRDLQGPVLAADIRMRDRDVWCQELANHYFHWVGLARGKDFAWWADAELSEAKHAIAAMNLVPVSLEGLKGTWFLHEGELDSFRNFQAPETPAVSLVPAGDLLTTTWRSFEGLMAPEDLSRPLAVGGGDGVRVTHPAMADQHFVIIGGRVAGSWTLGASGSVRPSTFKEHGAVVATHLKRRAAALSEFIQRELGQPGQGGGGASSLSSEEAVTSESGILSNMGNPRG